LFQARVRDFPLASVETARKDAPQAHQVPQPLDGQKKVAFPMVPLAVVLKALLASTHRNLPSAGSSLMAAESG